jgi:dTDP-4-dehydrorhamnose reductase
VRLLLLGRNGQVGWELQRSLAPLGEVIALDRNSVLPDGGSSDLADLDGLRAAVRGLCPNVIVNAAAFTTVDRAESEPELAQAINAEAPGVIAEIAQATRAWLVHYSTDYVFDGSGSAPWAEDDPTGPLCVDGSTKLEGEQWIAAACERHLIFRTSWVYAARGGNFAKTMLRLAAQRDHLTVIDDQFGAPPHGGRTDRRRHGPRAPTGGPAGDIRFRGRRDLPPGSRRGGATCHAYARLVLDTARELRPDLRLAVQEVTPVPTSGFPLAAPRPLNSRLDTRRLRDTFNLVPPPWQQGVRRMLTEMLNPEVI